MPYGQIHANMIKKNNNIKNKFVIPSIQFIFLPGIQVDTQMQNRPVKFVRSYKNNTDNFNDDDNNGKMESACLEFQLPFTFQQ